MGYKSFEKTITLCGKEFTAEGEVHYLIRPGDKEILNPVDKAQPGTPDEIEIEIEFFLVDFGDWKHYYSKGSKIWNKFEEQLNQDEDFLKEVYEHECALQESMAN